MPFSIWAKSRSVQEHYPEALDHFTDVISNFPSSFKLADARYKRGVTYSQWEKKPKPSQICERSRTFSPKQRKTRPPEQS